MNFTNINPIAIGTISYFTCFKLLFILALFFLNIYLYFSEPKFKKTSVLESGINPEKITKILRQIVYFSGAYQLNIFIYLVAIISLL